MNFLKKIFGLSGASASDSQCTIEFDANGKFQSVKVEQGRWSANQKGPHTYYRQKANTLLQASEILKKINAIPGNTYYLVETPDGTLGRDMNGFFTEAPVKTKMLKLATKGSKPDSTEFASLKNFGNMIANNTTVAQLKTMGEYSNLVLLMECGHCGYQSPVETQAGTLQRQCYCCGAENKGERGTVNVYLGSKSVAI